MEPVLAILLMGALIWFNLWFRKRARRSRIAIVNDPILKRARQRARRPARMMIVPPAKLGRRLDDKQCHDIGVALAERRIDDAVALWSAATEEEQMASLRAIDDWMADGTRITLDTRPAPIERTTDAAWPELPSRNTEPGSPHNDLR